MNPQTVADGLLVSLGDLTFSVIREHAEQIVTVSEEAIIAGMRHVWERMKIVIEPSAAVPVGALLERKVDLTGLRIGESWKMAPYDLVATVGSVGMVLSYVAIGFGFGFALERAGFGNSTKLAAQFYLHDMTVLKVMFTAIVVAMVLIFWASALLFLDVDRLYVNPTYMWPGILGGLLLGMGFIVGGY